MTLWSYPDTHTAIACFSAGDAQVTVTIEQRGHPWHVRFEVDGPPNEVAYNALSIFEGVFGAIAQFLAVREPQMVLFTTDREDLARIYRTYLQKESRMFAGLGYRLDSEHRVLRRFKPTRWAAAVQAES